jgi:hypothetical protein
LLAAMGLSKAQIEARLNEIGRPFGTSLEGGATPGNETLPGGSLLGALGQLARKLNVR